MQRLLALISQPYRLRVLRSIQHGVRTYRLPELPGTRPSIYIVSQNLHYPTFETLRSLIVHS